MPWQTTLYRRLLHLFPRQVRDSYGDDMAELFHEQLARHRGWRRAWLLLRAIVDVIRHGLGERIELFVRAPDVNPRRWWMGMIEHDVRYALRLIARQPATSAAILLTLAIGIGANTAVFAVVHAVLLRPLPYRDPARLVMVWEQRPAEANFTNWVSPADFLDWSARATSFETLSAFTADTADLTGLGDPRQIAFAGVTPPFFDVLGVHAALGRTFAQGDDVLGEHRRVVISHRLWQQHFGSDPAIIGRRVGLNGVTHEVIGVLRSDFEFPGEAIDVWAPLVLRGGSTPPPRAAHFLHVYGRLREHVSLDQAQGELQRVGLDLAALYPEENEGHGPRVVSLREHIVAPARQGLLVAMSAVAFLLLIACTNVAHLLLARSAGRRHELAIRAAVGAPRLRLLRQSLTESLVLAIVGGGLGLIIASWTLQLLVLQTPPALRGAGLHRAGLDLPVLLFAVGVCLAASFVAGGLPAWQVGHTAPADPLRDNGGRSPVTLRRGVRLVLIGGQVALTVILLIGAGLMTRTFLQVLWQPAGIDTASRLTVTLTLPRARYADADAIRRARRSLDERFATLPEIITFGATNNLPLSGSDARRGITVEGLVRTPGDAPVRAHTRIATPGYFRAAGITTRSGRLFGDRDSADAALVVVINETMARRYWPGQSPIGRRIKFNPADKEPWREVIGVIADVKHWGLDREVNPELYLPHDQQPSPTLSYVFHTTGDPLSVVPALKSMVTAADRDLPLGGVRTFDAVAAQSLATRRWAALLLAVLASLGILLAAAGIYGVMSHLVALRTGEISIRLSLGAHPGTILRTVMAEALSNAAVGLGAGLLGGLAVARILRSSLFDVHPADPITFTAVAGLVLAISTLAALAPALRAMRVDPLQALRQT